MSQSTPSTFNQPTLGQTPGSDEALRRARLHVRRLRGWITHASIYALVITGLWIGWLVLGDAGLPSRAANARFPWPLAPMLGWGLGVAIHGVAVWAKTSRVAGDWEARQMARYLEAEKSGRVGVPSDRA